MNPIALDAMGGDRMPDAALDGALIAAQEGLPVVLVGDEERLRAGLAQRGATLPIRHADDVIGMTEAAADVRRRRASSVMVAMRMVKDGEASAAVSMGHSGATMAAALFVLGRLRGVERPGLLVNIPVKDGFVALIDAGANAECRPTHLQQFAVMGSVFARAIWNIPDPSVGLMSIGEEAEKGNELVVRAHELLKGTRGIRFYGNVEGRDLFRGLTDVVVTDGFTGNVILKLAEGEAKELFSWVRDALREDLRGRIGGMLVRPRLRAIATKLNPSEYGAQPLLGVDGHAFIGHGSSDPRAVTTALRIAHRAVEQGLVDRIRSGIAGLGETRQPA
ncbi:MAG: phosphate acyltransferase PlsX [Deinococcales bacterium]